MGRNRAVSRAVVAVVGVVAVAACSGGASVAEPEPERSAGASPSASSTSAGPWAGVTGTRVSVTEKCDDSMAAAEQELDSAKATPLIVESLSVCSTVDEWLSALERRPGVMGLTDRAPIGVLDVQAACQGSAAPPVCADAEARGVNLLGG